MKITLPFLIVSTLFAGPEIGIFEKILESSSSFDETVTAFEKALDQSTLTLHATYNFNESNVNGQKSRLYLFTSPEYKNAAINEQPNTISAQIIRVAIYEYGAGRNTVINMMNPVAHAMVYYENSKSYSKLLSAANIVSENIRAIVTNIPGKVVSVQLPPLRTEKAYNNFNGDGPAKMMTMWKNWEESQDELFESSSLSLAVSKIESTLSNSKIGGVDECIGWKIISKIEIGDAVYFGITNDYTENRTTSINSDFRSVGKSEDAPLPGIDHTPAHPMEIIVYKDGSNYRAVQYGQMWRMQLYYWDSGYAAFAKYTMIPGIISGSIEELFNK